MSWISVAAIYFIIWWLVLFATLPFSLKTQDEEGETVRAQDRGRMQIETGRNDW